MNTIKKSHYGIKKHFSLVYAVKKINEMLYKPVGFRVILYSCKTLPSILLYYTKIIRARGIG
jgi:hypothetical protein